MKSDGLCVGLDISETACQLAQSKFSKYEFKTINLIKNDPEFSTTKNSDRTLWAIRGTLWYLVEKLPLVVSNLSKLVKENDFLLVVQNFPPVESNFFGKNIMPDYHSLIDHFSNEFNLERHIWYTDYSKNTNDNWFIGLFTLKEDV